MTFWSLRRATLALAVALVGAGDAARRGFDEYVVAEGARGMAAAREAREAGGARVVEVLGVGVQVGCELVVSDGNATVELRAGGKRRAFDASAPCEGAWPRCGGGAPATPVLCALRSRRSVGPVSRQLAVVTSVSDFGFLWRFMRWTWNTLCHADVARASRLAYYVFAGNPLAGASGAVRRAEGGCPGRAEEALGHTSKALSLYLLVSLKVAERVAFLDTDVWVERAALGGPFLEAFGAQAADAHVALPAPCYKQFFGAAVLLARSTEWALGFLGEWFALCCGPKDQPSLWHLVLRAAGEDTAAHAVLDAYHDARCVDASGFLTKSQCSCAPGGAVSRAAATCGYYAAWDLANAAFLRDVFGPDNIADTPALYEVAEPLFTPGGAVAYLPNAGRASPLLCGDAPPLRHVKFLRKADRDLDPKCGDPPPNLPFKGDR